MTITLTVRTALWRAHVARVANAVDGLVPVVKGNGYGFGRVILAEIASEFCDTVAVGTVHELDGLPDGLHAVVLTPTLAAPASTDTILTVGHRAHLECLDGWSGRVLVKLESSMHRYGGGVELIDVARARGLHVIGVSIHLPLVGSSAEHADEIRTTIAEVDTDLPVWLSHLDLETYASLPATHTYRLRLGTSLWHGDKSTLQLRADVLDVRPIRDGQHAGYRQGPVDGDGHLVMIGAGTASGVTALPDGRSPFHFERRRLRLHEAPHMHTSMAFVPDGDPVPEIGGSVDVQRPLTMTTVDAVDWI
ncbi:MAG TPA: alanine racemase [Ilumatobacteraceae bacterium]|nr:alanine racemase [Ilumatobacteraceae bacterium]